MIRPGLPLAAASLAALLHLAPAPPLAAEDWPQWMGPRRDGSISGMFDGAPVKLRRLWHRPAEERAWSGMAVAGDRVYTLEVKEGADFAVALDAATGRELWSVRLDPTFPGAVMESGPGSTPAVADGRVFAIASSCRLVALDAATGRLLWQHLLREKFGTGSHRTGCHTSPLLAGDRLIVQASGEKEHRLVALDPATGDVRWSSKGMDRTGSTSPVLADLGGVRQVLVHYRDSAAGVSGLYGARLSDGEVLWSVKLDQGSSVDTPLVLPGDRIVIQTFSDVRLFQLEHAGGQWKAAQVWASDALRAVAGSPVYHDGHLYGFGQDLLACVDAATGKTVWQQKLYVGAVALADGHLVAFSHPSGMVHVAEATPAGYREKARLEVFTPGPAGDTPPSLAGKRIFVRNNDEMAAVQMGG